MKIAHISDTHLGFRAYNRYTEGGFNMREKDVMTTFRRVLDQVLENDADLVIHSGDLFHVVRPSNATIVEAYKAVAAFQHRRDYRPFVLIGGNHDTPKTSESGNILRLFMGIPGISIHPVEIESIAIPTLDTEVLCVPSVGLTQRGNVDWVPQLNQKFQVLTVHGMATQAMLPSEADFDISETRHETWTYVALGDYHKFQAFGRNVCYAGSTDFTSTNIWEEIDTPKGWVLFDSEVGQLELQTVETRAVIDLPVIDADGLCADELSDRLVKAATWAAEMPIVRQVVRNVRPEVRAKLSLDAMRSIQARVLDYRLTTYPPDVKTVGLTSAGRAQPLEASWSEHVAEVKLPAGVAREDLKQLGLDLLEEVKERETAPTEA